MPKHVLVIYNPTAKSQAQTESWFANLIDKLNEKDEYLVSFYPTTAHTGPEHLVPLFKPPLDLVVAAGGDGTVRFALAALAKAQASIPCAILPLGTGNLLARNLGIVQDSLFANPLEHAFDYIANGKPMKMDMAMVNGEYFAGVAGVGPLSDAFMTPAREAKTKFRLMAYVAELLKTLLLPPRIFTITTGGKSFKVKGGGIFISNIDDFGVGKSTDMTSLTDGLLTLRIVNPMHFKDYVALGFRFAAGKVDDSVPEYLMPVKEAVVEVQARWGARSAFQEMVRKTYHLLTRTKLNEPPRTGQAAVMMDGEEHGLTPMRVTVLPQAVTVWVPKAQVVPDEKGTETAAANASAPHVDLRDLRMAM